MAPMVAELLDYANTDIYVEPFGGACRVLLNKPRHDVEIYNDYGEGVCALMRIMSHSDTAQELIDRLLDTEYSLEEFQQAKAIYDACENDPEEKAKRHLLTLLQNNSNIKRTHSKVLLSDQMITENNESLNAFRQWKASKPDSWNEFVAVYEQWYPLFQKKRQQGYLERTRDLCGLHISDMDLAVATYIVFTQSRDAMGANWSAYRFKDNEAYHNHMIGLSECAERMDGVQVHQIDAINFFRWGGVNGQLTEWLNNSRVMMYLDPSYIRPETEQRLLSKININSVPNLSKAIAASPKNLGDPYATSFSYADHEAFLERICDAKCRVMISNYDLLLYDKYLTPARGWKRIEYQTTTGVGSKKDNQRLEVLWYNY